MGVHKPKISVIVIGFNMERELSRTLLTLEPPFQAFLELEDIEIILVDNGSQRAYKPEPSYTNVKCLNVVNPTHSPAAAINLGLRHASADFVGVMVDGARMASPQLLFHALMAKRLSSRALVTTLGYHLGPDVQMVSVQEGYNQEQEDALLASVSWQEDGYELFNISVFAGSSAKGWFVVPTETNALFMSKDMWDELGGADEAFESPGGGYVNHDLFKRACELDKAMLISLLGEGTFHQVHGGIATNNKAGKYSRIFREEYKSIRGFDFSKPTLQPLFLGSLKPQHAKHIEKSLGLIP